MNSIVRCQPCPAQCPACAEDTSKPAAQRSTQCHHCLDAMTEIIDAGPGNCTQCGGSGAEVPWGQNSLLCWDCTDVQLDLMAMACRTASGLPVEVKLA